MSVGLYYSSELYHNDVDVGDNDENVYKRKSSELIF